MVAFMQNWPFILFGWPSAILGGALQIAGIVRRNTTLAALGAVVSLGFCVYIALSPPPFRWFGLLAIIGNFISAAAVKKHASVLAVIAFVPFVAVAVYLAVKVLNQ